MINKKCGIFVLVVVFCVIPVVFLRVIVLPREEESRQGYVPELPVTSKWHGNEEIRIYREYLRIPSVHPNIDYEPCVEFLKRQAVALDLPLTVVYPVNDKNPVVIITWVGSQPNLPSIMLNSHMDVVPVYEESWTHPPFAADVDEDGKIFARGSQDAKSIGMLQLAAIRALKKDGVKQLKRTIHVTFVPDEELGGNMGMAGFVHSDKFKDMNVGYSLDETAVSSANQLRVIYDERSTWRIEFVFGGPTGHGSALYKNTAGEKISYLISKMMEMRESEIQRMNAEQLHHGNITSINLTILKGGVQGNVLPPELSVVFDVRVSTQADHDVFERQINQWCIEAGGNYTINYLVKDPKAAPTATDATNPMWVVLENTVKEFGYTVVRDITPGGTDARFLRRLNISAFGFTSLTNMKRLGHQNDEYVQADEYLKGIQVYTKIVSNLGSM